MPNDVQKTTFPDDRLHSFGCIIEVGQETKTEILAKEATMFEHQLKSLLVTFGRPHQVPRAVGKRKRLLSWLIAATVFLGVISATAKADNIVFTDPALGITTVTKAPPEGTATESISIEAGPTCVGETCSITIRGENNFALQSIISLFGFTTVDDHHFYWTILGPELGPNRVISDVVLLDTTNAGETDLGAVLTFRSDPEAGGDFTQFLVAENSPIENGQNQQILSLTWQDPGLVGDTANIFVASDSPDVPEPSTVMLLVTGLGLLGGASYRRRVRSASKTS
jgi:PEP-CTERM motif